MAKWLPAADGKHGIPLKADGVLQIDPTNDEVRSVGGPFVGFEKWEGGALADDGCMYCFPLNARPQDCAARARREGAEVDRVTRRERRVARLSAICVIRRGAGLRAAAARARLFLQAPTGPSPVRGL